MCFLIIQARENFVLLQVNLYGCAKMSDDDDFDFNIENENPDDFHHNNSNTSYQNQMHRLHECMYYDENIVEVERNLFEKANSGDSDAQYRYANFLTPYVQCEEDDLNRVYWFRMAAEQDHLASQYELGCYYAFFIEGKVKDENLDLSNYWFKRAAKNGDAASQFFIAISYQKGQGVALDIEKAILWYEKSAQQESEYRHMAYQALAEIYLDEKGAYYDIQKAINHFELAVKYGSDQSAITLGSLYFYGRGVSVDYELATYWYTKAGNNSSYEGFMCLGDLYSNGIGVTKNYVEAYKWFKLASMCSASNDCTSIKIIAEQMSGQDVILAELKAIQFESKHRELWKKKFPLQRK